MRPPWCACTVQHRQRPCGSTVIFTLQHCPVRCPPGCLSLRTHSLLLELAGTLFISCLGVKLTAFLTCTGTGHSIALDLCRTELFCCTCKDYVYDADFDTAATVRRSVLLSFPKVRKHMRAHVEQRYIRCFLSGSRQG